MNVLSHTQPHQQTFGHVVFQLGVCNSIFISPMDLDEGCFLNKHYFILFLSKSLIKRVLETKEYNIFVER